MVGEELRENVTRIFREQWSVVTKKFIAAPEDLRLGNEAGFYESATVLYADLSGSTHMVDHHEWTMAAEVYKAYLDCAARIIKSQGGAIAAYDGDRIMAVFLNERKNTAAAKAALMINYAVLKIINPALKAQYPSVDFHVEHVIGIETSPLRAARIGVRNDNDLVWVGKAANHAAKLTALKVKGKTTWISPDVYDELPDWLKQSKLGASMWDRYNWNAMGGVPIMGSSYYQPF